LRSLLLLDLRRGHQTRRTLVLEIDQTNPASFGALAGNPVRFGVAGNPGGIHHLFFSPTLGQIMFLLEPCLLIWLIMPVFFSVHGIYTLQLNAFPLDPGKPADGAVHLPNTGLFLLVFVIINTGMNFLWNTPSDNSWWMLVGIAGHAFVSTALLAASFIYYRDINAWLSAVLEQLQNRTSSAKAN